MVDSLIFLCIRFVLFYFPDNAHFGNLTFHFGPVRIGIAGAGQPEGIGLKTVIVVFFRRIGQLIYILLTISWVLSQN